MAGLALMRRAAGAAAGLVAVLAGCGGGDQTVRDESLQVASHMSVCQALVERLCLRTRASSSSGWTLQYEPIDGLAYAWGREYTLAVRITESRGSGAQDAPSVQRSYRLLAVTSSSTVAPSATFALDLAWPQTSLTVDAGGERSLLGWRLSCDAPACQALDAARSGGQPVRLQMDHRNAPDGPLHVTAVEPPPA